MASTAAEVDPGTRVRSPTSAPVREAWSRPDGRVEAVVMVRRQPGRNGGHPASGSSSASNPRAIRKPRARSALG